MPSPSHLHRLRASLLDSLRILDMQIEQAEKPDKPKVKRDLRQERIDKYSNLIMK